MPSVMDGLFAFINMIDCRAINMPLLWRVNPSCSLAAAQLNQNSSIIMLIGSMEGGMQVD